MKRPQSSRKPNNNQSVNLAQTRPKSAKEKYPIYSNSSIIKNSSKIMEKNNKSKVMPKNAEKEQLYEDTVLLKIKINNLRKELDQAKSSIVQKDLEIKKKNKIIEDCTRDNDIDFVHKENIEKGKETTSITLCKKKYYETKKLFKKKCEENEILKAHIKISKVKELEKENQKLQNELGKIKDLYLNSQFEIENENKEIDNLLEYKNKFIEQHILLDSLKKNCEQLNKENSELKKQLNIINDLKEKNQKEKKKLKTINMKLKFNNEKFLIERKQRENSTINEGNYKRQMKELSERLEEYKKDYNQKTKFIEELNKATTDKKKNEVQFVLNPSELKENINSEKQNQKLEFIKSLLKDAQFKIDIYEDYITTNNYNLSKILRKYKYNNGLMNSNSPPLQLNINLNSNIQNRNSPKKKKEDTLQVTNKNEIYKESYLKEQEYIKSEEKKEIEKKVEEKKEDEKKNEENEKDLSIDFLNKIKSSIPHILLINLESNHLKKDKLEELMKNIYEDFEKKGEDILKNDFIEPFQDLFVKNLKLKKKSDIQIINFYLDDLLESNNNDTDKFQGKINAIFNSINDFSSINEKEMNNNLKNELLKYPKILDKFKEKDINKNFIISYFDVQEIHSQINLNLNNESLEYLIYKMKITVPQNYSMIDLNYQFINDLLIKDNSKIEEEKIEKESSSIDLENILKSNNLYSEKGQSQIPEKNEEKKNNDEENILPEKITENNDKKENEEEEENYDDFVMDNAQLNNEN